MTKGKKLHREKWKQVALKDVALCCNESERDEEKRKQSKYISVEHITSEDFRIKSWSDVEMPTFFRKFSQGDVLVALRRVYLKKVAVAEFDGICSPHIYVFRSKPDKMLQKFLPFVFNESFFDFAIRHSAGSISPYVYWKTIKEFQFLLPPLSEQKLMADILYQIEDAIEKAEAQELSLKKYKMALIDQLFQENGYLGNIIKITDCQKVKFGNIVKQIKVKADSEYHGLERFVAGEHMQTDDLKIRHWGIIGEQYVGPAFTNKFSKGQVLYGSRRTYLRKVAVADFDGICANTTFVIEANQEELSQKLLPYLMHSESFTNHSVENSKGSTNPYINWKDIASFEFSIPKIVLQENAAKLFQQFDNAIEQTRQHHASLRSFKKGLLAEWLG
ncbi:MAG: restriction endonuclease subunit S [Candidatus Brocadiae bacterium]|nr:restriction endonuclease subunit S [Candidatus Brocadiia bacterium]